MRLSSTELKVIYAWPNGGWGYHVNPAIKPICDSLVRKGVMEVIGKAAYKPLFWEYMTNHEKIPRMSDKYGKSILNRPINQLAPAERKIKIEYQKLRGRSFYLDSRCFKFYRYKKRTWWIEHDPEYIGLTKQGVKEHAELILRNKRFVRQDKEEYRDVRDIDDDDGFL